MPCDFEDQTLCHYTNDATDYLGRTNTETWSAVKGPFKNLLTGIQSAAQGDYFAATYLNPNQGAQMSINIALRKNFVINFQGYRATNGIDLIVGCQSANQWNILYNTTDNVDKTDYRNWKNVSLFIQTDDCTNFFISAFNKRKNIGAAGVDNIQVFYNSYNCSTVTKVAKMVIKIYNFHYGSGAKNFCGKFLKPHHHKCF